MALIVKEEYALIGAIKSASPGQQILYHVGNLAKDRDGRENLKLNLFAKSVYQKFLDGYVDLVQRKLGIDCYEYLAIRTSKPVERSADLNLAGAA